MYIYVYYFICIYVWYLQGPQGRLVLWLIWSPSVNKVFHSCINSFNHSFVHSINHSFIQLIVTHISRIYYIIIMVCRFYHNKLLMLCLEVVHHTTLVYRFGACLPFLCPTTRSRAHKVSAEVVKSIPGIIVLVYGLFSMSPFRDRCSRKQVTAVLALLTSLPLGWECWCIFWF